MIHFNEGMTCATSSTLRAMHNYVENTLRPRAKARRCRALAVQRGAAPRQKRAPSAGVQGGAITGSSEAEDLALSLQQALSIRAKKSKVARCFFDPPPTSQRSRINAEIKACERAASTYAQSLGEASVTATCGRHRLPEDKALADIDRTTAKTERSAATSSRYGSFSSGSSTEVLVGTYRQRARSSRSTGVISL